MLTAKQKQAARLLAEGSMSDEEAARQLGISLPVLNRWKNSAEFADARDGCLREVLEERAYRAFFTLTDIMLHSQSDSSRLSAAKDLLDRAGYKGRDAPAGRDSELRITVSYGTGDENGNQNSEQ